MEATINVDAVLHSYIHTHTHVDRLNLFIGQLTTSASFV